MAMSEPRRRRLLIAAGVVAVLVAGVVAALVLRGDDPSPSPGDATTTTAPTTTADEQVTGPIAPLTGAVVDETDQAALDRLFRPALAVKIDNAPAGYPQVGLDRADIVVEVQVEGISRFMAVVHSQQVDELGPVRSARTSDPALLAMFGEPLFAWSGGNPAVIDLVESSPWIRSRSANRERDAYSRDRTRRAPHNLMVDAGALFDTAGDDVVVPTPLFAYRPVGQWVGGEPVAGVQVAVGASRSAWVWSEESETWLRSVAGEPHEAAGGGRIRAANVVVAATPYEASAADQRSPEAQSVGSGVAWVLTGGEMVRGRWERDRITQPWRLLREGGAVISLAPGPTWVLLPAPGAEPQVLDADAAADLLGD